MHEIENNPDKFLSWDLQALQSSLKLTANEIEQYFTDGRRVSFLIERRVAREILNGKLAPSEKSPYDIEDSSGRKWECRSLSKGGIYFSPSSNVGSGRKFSKFDFFKKLELIYGYVIADISLFPMVPLFFITSTQVLRWWENGKLKKDASISRKKMIILLTSEEGICS